jgi:hypothetical protein
MRGPHLLGMRAALLCLRGSNDHIASEPRRLKRLKEQWEEGVPWFGLGPP